MAVKELCRWGAEKKVMLAKKPHKPKQKPTQAHTFKNYHEWNVKLLCFKSIEINFL